MNYKKIYVNGNVQEIQEHATVRNVLELLGLENKRIAVELNQELLPRSQFADKHLSAQDRIEIIHAVGGG